MTTRFEYLLCLIGIQSTTRQPVESPSTAPLRLTRQDALAELSYALQGKHRLPVAAALLRWSPDLLSRDQLEELRVAVRDAVLVYGLTLRPRLPDARLPKAVLQATHCAMQEHAEWEPCGTCKGKGKIQRMSDHAGEGLIDVKCPDCEGIGWKGWGSIRRARVMGIPVTAGRRHRLEMAKFGAALLHSWASEGVSVIRDMASGRRKSAGIT